MKRLVVLATCLAMLTLTGCANGLLGGVFSGTGYNSQPSFFGGGSGSNLFSDGPIRQFLRGDQCDSCNAHAGQLSNSGAACDSCGPNAFGGSNVLNDPYALPAQSAPVQQPVTSFYPESNGVPLDQSFLPEASLGTPLQLNSAPLQGSGLRSLSEPPLGGIN